MDDSSINSLMNMYSKCGSLENARSIFDGMESKNIITWNAMIAAYGQHGNGKEALDLYHQMEEQGIIPDSYTYTCLLSICADMAALEEGKRIHKRIVDNNIEWTIPLATA